MTDNNDIPTASMYDNNNDIPTSMIEHFNRLAQSVFNLPTFLKTARPTSPMGNAECDDIFAQLSHCFKTKDNKAECVLLQEKLLECMDTYDKVK